MRPALYAFSGGGTGGHLMPGLAIAAALRQFEPDVKIEFVGSTKPLEHQLVMRHGYPHLALPVEPLKTLKQAPWRFAWKNWHAYRHAVKWLNEKKPRCVIGLGGYASAPLVLAAARIKIPTLILEQNVVPGRATRWLAHRVRAVVTSFAATREWLTGEVHELGTPVRAKIAALADGSHASTELPASSDSSLPRTLLILGGSQGAAALNEVVLRMVEKSSDLLAGLKILHQAGADHVRAVQERYARQEIAAEATGFIDDMASCLHEASLVISRSGATTLAELACSGRPAILVPFPFAVDDHQRKNADFFVNAGAARLVEQQADPEITASLLREALTPLVTDSAAANSMSLRMHSLARPSATADILALIQKISE